MSIRRNANKRPSFLSRLVAAIMGARKRPSQSTEENPSTCSDSGDAPIGLPGSKWDFGCSPAASSEIAKLYDLIERPPYDLDSSPPTPLENSKARLNEQKKSTGDDWIHYEGDTPDPYK